MYGHNLHTIRCYLTQETRIYVTSHEEFLNNEIFALKWHTRMPYSVMKILWSYLAWFQRYNVMNTIRFSRLCRISSISYTKLKRIDAWKYTILMRYSLINKRVSVNIFFEVCNTSYLTNLSFLRLLVVGVYCFT
jgi:hypothetical protein